MLQQFSCRSLANLQIRVHIGKSFLNCNDLWCLSAKMISKAERYWKLSDLTPTTLWTTLGKFVSAPAENFVHPSAAADAIIKGFF
ncbi:hypothetical protein CEXT_434491 [Caerostris extrusa]|uniref:Uncharacterized protein n=1 Tax=Caerostris extrusa TaxID=172846 RepID=A0AAV4MJN6_CAEEX|nr:hypothetical protein CEXT_434491 [Caerostris extrusa]